MELISTKRGIVKIKTERTNQFKLIRNNIEIITNELMYTSTYINLPFRTPFRTTYNVVTTVNKLYLSKKL